MFAYIAAAFTIILIVSLFDTALTFAFVPTMIVLVLITLWVIIAIVRSL